MQGGRKGELDLAQLLGKRATVTATGLRSRPLPEKAEIVADVTRRLWPMFAGGSVKPIVHGRVPMSDAAQAHRMLEAGDVVGKLVLEA
jgi:NADPH:quinone reductase-like Zn-dependent oxidoreductase